MHLNSLLQSSVLYHVDIMTQASLVLYPKWDIFGGFWDTGEIH